ncbi:MAG: STT3 domain-containing protein [Promethearchaeia archaeon]
MSRIGESFKNFRDRIKAAVNVKARNILFFTALFLIVIIAILIRLSPILQGPKLIKAFDPWIQYYNAEYLSEHSLFEYFHWHDYKSWFPKGMDRSNLRPGLTFTVVIIYKLLNFFGLPISLYNVCYFFPAFMGGMTVLAAYFLGKEILDRKMGLFAAFFLAFNTGHMQRTMAGFFDNETIGVFAVLMTLVFFLKTIKTGRTFYSLIGGIFLGYLTLSWGGLTFGLYIIPLVCGVLVLLNKYDENVLTAYAGVEGVGLLIYSLFTRFNVNELFSSLKVGGVFAFTIVLTVYHLIYQRRRKYPNFYRNLLNTIKYAIIPGSIIIAVVVWIDPDLIPLAGGRLDSILSPFMRDQMHIVASVAEHMPSSWSNFYYNTLIPLLVAPLGIFFCFKRLNASDITLMAFFLTLFYFTSSMVRIVLLFAPAVALVAAYGLVNILKIFGSFLKEKSHGISRKRKRQLKQTVGKSEVYGVYILIGFLCIAQVSHATEISINQLSHSQIVAGGQFHDWEDSLTWMKSNLAGTDVVASWWDYGYWLTPIGNVTTINDNGTWNSTQIGLTGMSLMQTNEINSAKILKRLQAEYVLVYFGFLINGLGGDEGKWPWMLRICNDHYNKYKEWGLEEDNWKEDQVFDESEYINNTSGQYEDKWFESQLVKLMFYGEPTNVQSITDPNANYLKYHYASQIGGDQQRGVEPRKDDNGNTWESHIPENGEYDLKVFQPTYFSSNGMVKIYKVDYTALDSSFSIEEPQVYNDGHGTLRLENTGKKDLEIKEVEINQEPYNFSLSQPGDSTTLEQDGKEIVWIEPSETTSFNKDDTVNVTVTAEADALGEETYTFDTSTSNLFVKESEPSDLRINRNNSNVVQNMDQNNDPTDSEIYLEVENTGDSITNLDEFYSVDLGESFTDVTYLQGSSILAPGEKAYVKITKSPPFYPLGISNHIVGVEAFTGEKDETYFSGNMEDYKLSILSEERITSPEAKIFGDSATRDHIPVDLNGTVGYIDDNGTIDMNIHTQNTGDLPFGLHSVNLTEQSTDTQYGTLEPDEYLEVGDNKTTQLQTSEFDLAVNDEIFTSITGNFEGETKASDIGKIHLIKRAPDLTMLEDVNDDLSSYILADESGELLIKNTGNETITLDNISITVNDTTQELSIEDDISFEYGDKELGIQECAITSFDDLDLNINESTPVDINITTTESLSKEYTLNATVNLPDTYNYGIEINKESSAQADDDLNLLVDNIFKNVTVDSVYVNDTYIPLNNFTKDGDSFEIESDGQIELGMKMSELETFLDVSQIENGDKLDILVRTKEGAEDQKDIDVTSS